VKVEVTEEDITYGRPNNAFFCPIARALKRGGLHGVDVGRVYISFTTERDNPDTWKGIVLPDEAKNFIEAFDSGAKVEPISFVLEYK